MTAPPRAKSWVDVGAVDDIRRAAPASSTPQGDVAVFRRRPTGLRPRRPLPAQGRPPEPGHRAHGESVTCPLHNWVIESGNRRGSQGADEGCVATVPLRHRGRPPLSRSQRAGQPRPLSPAMPPTPAHTRTPAPIAASAAASLRPTPRRTAGRRSPATRTIRRISAGSARRARRWARPRPRRPAASSGDRGERVLGHRARPRRRRLRRDDRAHGPDSVAFYVSGQLLTEDYYVANKLMKGFIGSANIDTNSRLCMASSVAGHRRAFGADTVPGCYEDLEEADLVVLVGSNLRLVPSGAVPALLAGARKGPKLRSSSSIRAAPQRRTRRPASRHRPGIGCGAVRRPAAHLQGAGRSTGYVARHTPGSTAALPKPLPDEGPTVAPHRPPARQALRRSTTGSRANRRVVTVYSQGVNQSVAGTDKVNAIINCHLPPAASASPGHGAVLADRPAQRHGRARGRRPRQPARRPSGDREPGSPRAGAAFWRAAPSRRSPA
jgi:hypothetical protein